MNKIIFGILSIILAVGLYRSVTAFSPEAQAATIQAVDQGAGQPATGLPAQPTVTAEKAQAAPAACGGSCNPATCGCSPSQCGGNSCGGGGGCGRR